MPTWIPIVAVIVIGLFLAVVFFRGKKESDNVEIFKKEPPKGF